MDPVLLVVQKNQCFEPALKPILTFCRTCPCKVLPVLDHVSPWLQGQRQENSEGNKARRLQGSEWWETSENGRI